MGRCTDWNMLGRVERPSAHASAMIGNGVVAVGRVVADEGWAGVVCSPRWRIGPVHTKPTGCISRWSATTFRLRLYEATGFSEVCSYHYRTAG